MGLRIRPHHGLGTLIPLALVAAACGGGDLAFTAVGTTTGGVDRMVFVAQPPDDVDARERFRVEVALVDEDGDLVRSPGSSSPGALQGRQRRAGQRAAAGALTDDLPEHGPQGPQPALFSDQFEVD